MNPLYECSAGVVVSWYCVFACFLRGFADVPLPLVYTSSQLPTKDLHSIRFCMTFRFLCEIHYIFVGICNV